MVAIVYTGTQNITKTPYISLSKVSNVLESRTTCASRLETGLYGINIYEDNKKDLKSLVTDVKNVLNKQVLKIQNRRLLNLLLIEEFEQEVIESLFQTTLNYEVITEKDISANFETGLTTGANLAECLFKRFNSDTYLSSKVNGFSTNAFTRWKPPRLFIPNFRTVEEFVTTCSIVRNTQFDLSVEAYTPEETEEILEEIDHLFSYAKFKFDDGTVVNLEWTADVLVELELGLWLGSITYELMEEESI